MYFEEGFVMQFFDEKLEENKLVAVGGIYRATSWRDCRAVYCRKD
jgi:hypothetical protein